MIYYRLIAQKLDGVHHTGDDVSQILLNLKFDLELLFDDTAWETFVTRKFIKYFFKVCLMYIEFFYWFIFYTFFNIFYGNQELG